MLLGHRLCGTCVVVLSCLLAVSVLVSVRGRGRGRVPHTRCGLVQCFGGPVSCRAGLLACLGEEMETQRKGGGGRAFAVNMCSTPYHHVHVTTHRAEVEYGFHLFLQFWVVCKEAKQGKSEKNSPKNLQAAPQAHSL